MKQQTFLKGAIILMIAGLINRLLGFALRVVMVRYLGDEGVGLYSMIYPVYVTLILVSTAGFPVALAKLVSEKNAVSDVHAVNRVFKLTTCLIIATSSLAAIFICFFARWMASSLFSDLRTYPLLLVIAPALIFVAIASNIRSYFQGLRTMTPTAVSQTIEQIVRIVASFFFIGLLINRGLVYGTTGATIGITLGEFAGMAVVVIYFVIHRYFHHGNDLLARNLHTAPPTTYSYRQATRDVINLSVPVTLNRLVISLMFTLDAILIPSQLQASGLSVAEATSLYGQLSGIALQIIFLPTIISSSLTTSLVPAISHAMARNNLQVIRARYHEVLRITFYIGIPATFFFVSRGSAICHMLFNFATAGPLLNILGLGAVFTYYNHVVGGVLNGLGKPHLAMKNTVLGAAFKLGGLLTLVSHPLFGVKGAAISIVAGWIVGAVADFISIGRIIGFQMDIIHLIIKPLLGAVFLYFALPTLEVFGTFLGLNARLTTLLTLCISALIYFFWLVIVKGLTKTDLQKFR